MRGSGDPQEVMLAVVNLQERVPKDRSLRTSGIVGYVTDRFTMVRG